MRLRDAYAGKRVLVTGDTGFKGAWLAIWLGELGAEVTGLALPPTSPRENFAVCDLASTYPHVDADVRDISAVTAVIAKARPEIVFHLAAQALVRESYRDPRGTFETNIMGTVNVLDVIRRSPSVQRVVVVTSDKCYAPNGGHLPHHETDPFGGDDPYSASKGAAELVAAAYRRSYFSAPGTAAIATVRAGNVMGGGDWGADRIIPDLMRAVERDRELVIRRPDAVRPWQHVLDALHGYLLLAAHLESKDFAAGWNLGPSEAAMITVRELVEKMIGSVGAGRYRIELDPDAPAETERLLLDSVKARNQLGWAPILDLAQTISWTAEGYRVSHAALGARRDQIRRFMELASA